MVNRPPVLNVPRTYVPLHGARSIAAAQFFSAVDPDGDTIQSYEFWDSGLDAASGRFMLGGIAQGTDVAIPVAAADLANLSFQFGSVSDQLWVRASDGESWSSWVAFEVAAPANVAPVVSASDLAPAKGTVSIVASSLFSVSDADGDPIQRYEFWDSGLDPNSGHFVLSGTPQGSNVSIPVTAANLSNLSFQLGSVSDQLWVRAYDGISWSSWQAFNVAAPVNIAPVVTITNPTVTPSHGTTLIAASTLFSAADSDGDPIQSYEFWDSGLDSNSGRFVLGGVAQGIDVAIPVSAANLANLRFQLGSVSDQLWVRAYDGTAWGTWQSVDVAPPPNAAPTVTITKANVTPSHGTTTIAASSFFSASDPDGDTIQSYEFWDSGLDPNSGRFILGGTAQGTDVAIPVTAANLANLRFKPGSVSDQLWVRAFDGTAWSTWKSFNVAPPPNAAPTVSITNANVAPSHGTTSFAASAFFSATDPDDDTIQSYEFWDSGLDPNSGYFVLSGAAQATNAAIAVTAANLANLRFQLGSVSDQLWVRAFDGAAWSAWQSFDVAPPPNAAPVVTIPSVKITPARQTTTIAASTLFSATDADGDAITRYRFFDDTTGNGYFLLNGVAQAENANIEITSAQLPSFAYQVSATEAGDVLWVQAYDSVAWSQWKSFTVNAPRNTAPVVTVDNIAPSAGTKFIAAADLFVVFDADGDAITQYRLFDGTSGNGYFTINGNAQPSERNITLDAASLAATRFVTSTDGNDIVWVQAFDGLEWSEWRSFTIDAVPVGPIIMLPLARADFGRTNEDTALTIAVLANDENGGSSSLRVSAVTQGAHGSVSINSDGSLRYTPAANYAGTDSFSYTIRNETGTSTATVSLTIDPVNDAPTARDDSGLTTPRNVAKTITAQTLLANDSDVDGDTLTITGVSGANGGTVALVSGNVVFTPTTNYSGAAGFTYTISDGKGGQASARVSLTVLGNAPPIAADDSVIGSGPRTINVLANDSDPNGDTLSILGFTQPSHGTVTLNADKTFTYVPTAGYVGSDSFVYTLSDQQGGQDSATVTISVMPVATNFRQILSDASEDNWASLNINFFSDVWTPKSLRPSGDGPISIIGAWSSMAWDSNRGDLIFFGGGHAHYGGNDVYRWRSSTLSWERASLPTQVTNVGNHQETVDGAANTPIAAHTYDNSEFLPIADRWMTWGGAAYNTGGKYLDANGKQMGPYFWDPSLADGNKIGSAPGSGVDPTTPAVDMWTNRSAGLPATGPRPGDNTWGFVGGTTAYAQENGKDVIYLSDGNLWKYTVNDVNDPTKDTYEKIGIYWNGYGVAHGAGAIDVADGIFLRSTGSANFTYWDLNQAGPNNKNVLFVPTVTNGTFNFAGLGYYGMDFDSKRGQFVLWNGDREVWILKPPEVLSPNGWTLTRAPLPTLTEVPVLADSGNTTGVFGKWKYIAEQDIFLGVMDQTRGTIWAYKPEDWQPQNSLPSLTIGDLSGLRAAQGTVVDAKSFVTWSDPDGDHVHFTFTDQTASASSGHFRLNGVDQAANVAISVSDAQLRSGALLWITGQAGSQDQIRVTAGDPFGEAAALNFTTPAAMAALIAQAPASLASAPSGTDTSLLQTDDDQIYLAGNGV